MKLFDSHCHLDDKSFQQDRDLVFQRARQANVQGIMLVGITLENAHTLTRLAEQSPGCFSSVGIHPHDAASCSNEALETLMAITDNPVVKAWGETGLDFNRMYAPQDIQEKWFIRQIDIACALNLPMIFHERDSNGRFLELLKHHAPPGLRGVVHCFSGNKEEMHAYLDLGLYIGITGILTIKKRGKDLRALAKDLPAESILIETDAPYLTPAPQKNKTRRNEPAFVKSTLLKLAEVKDTDPEALSETIWDNTLSLYNISPTELMTS